MLQNAHDRCTTQVVHRVGHQAHEVPADYNAKKQLAPDGSRVDMNVGGVIIMPEGFKLAPRDRLPKDSPPTCRLLVAPSTG